MTTTYYLKVVPVSKDHTDCQACRQRTDTTFFLADVPDLPENFAALELCDECRDKVLIPREEQTTYWERYLRDETREQAQARAAVYMVSITDQVQFISKLINRLWDAEEQIKRLAGQTSVASAPVVDKGVADRPIGSGINSRVLGVDSSGKPSPPWP